jgi:uncharacterized protein (TIRG00374 family)
MESKKDRRQKKALDEKATALSQADAFCSRRRERFKLALGGAVFILLTTSIFIYQFSRIDQGGETFNWRRLHFEYLWLMLLCLPFDTLASGLRMWLVCKVLQPGIGFWTCLKAEWANSGIAMLTPSQTGGGFGQIYMLHRGGASVSTATTISLITFFGTMVSLLIVGLYSVLTSGLALGPFFSMAIWPLTLVLGLMIFALLWPSLFRVALNSILRAFRYVSKTTDSHWNRMDKAAARLIDLVYDYHDGTWRFIHTGKAQFAGVCLLSFVFILARCLMAFLCLRFLGIGNATLGEVLHIQMALMFLLYFAPTPGGSGLAEVFSLSAMATIVPAGLAPYYNLIWRTSTVYLSAVLGLLFLALTLLRDTQSVLRQRKPRRECRSQLGLCVPVEGQLGYHSSPVAMFEESVSGRNKNLRERGTVKCNAIDSL